MSENNENSDVVQRIQNTDLSPSQMKVTEYLLTGGLDVVHYTIAQIAEAVDVNASTVVRTAQSLGYPGFPEFQEALRSQLLRQARLSQRMQLAPSGDSEDTAAQDGQMHILDRVLRNEIKNMMELPQQVSYDTFDTVVDALDNATHVYIIGLGASFPVALNFGNTMRYVRKRVTVLQPGIDPIAAQLADIEVGDVLVSICFSRYMRETLTAMEYAQKRGIQVVAVTDSLIAPPAKRADLTLVVSHRYRLYGNAVALFALLDALLGALFQRYPERTRERLDQLEDLYKSFRLLSDDDV